MTDRGAWSSTPTGSGSVTIPAGYHNGSGKVNTTTVYNNGYNAGVTAADNRVNTNSTNYKSGYNAGYSAGHNTALSIKYTTVSVSGVAGKADFTDESGKTESRQYVQASYNVPGTVVAIRLDDTTNGNVWSYWTRVMNKTFTAQSATGFRVRTGATVTNTLCKIPLYTSSGPGSHTFKLTIYYVT